MVEGPDQARILLITAHRDEHVQGQIDRGLAGALGESVDVAEFFEIEFLIDKKVEIRWRGKDVSSYEKIIMYGGVGRLLRVAHPLALTLLANGQDLFTSGAENYRGLDKLSQNVYFALDGIPIPKTYYAAPDLLVNNAPDIIGFPLVLKDILASQGERNYLIRSQQEFEEKRTDMQKDRYIAQEYIKNKGDVRVLINNKGSMFAFKRSAVEGTHLNNVTKGASVERIDDLPEDLVGYCVKIIKNFNAPLLGIDVIERDGKCYFLEANTQPAIFSGDFIGEKSNVLLRSVT